MNPTTPLQPPELSPLTAYYGVSTTGKTGGWIGVRLDDEGHHTVPERASPRSWQHGRQKATLARLCLPAVVVRKTHSVFRDDENPKGSRTTRRAGRPMARPVPGRGETRDRGHPRRLSETNGMHGASGYRVRTDAQYATPLAGPTYRARTRYRLAGPYPASEKLPAGTRDRPAVPRWNPRPSGRGGCQSSPFIAANSCAWSSVEPPSVASSGGFVRPPPGSETRPPPIRE